MSTTVRAPFAELHISHGLTYVSLACGVAAIATSAVPGGTHMAGACLALAAVADTFDGRFARLFARSERHTAAGGAIDSLVDACVFGMAPIAVFARHATPAPGLEALIWWMAASIYAVAAVTRLAFFNIESDQRTFVGVPTPAIALLWSSVLLTIPSSLLVIAMFVVMAVLMVAPLVIPRPRAPGLAVFTLWAAGLLLVHVQELVG
jgi:CDP-diacylglycerol--serine O-phosphatidyltransferase